MTPSRADIPAATFLPSELAAIVGGRPSGAFACEKEILGVFSSTASPVSCGVYVAVRGSAADGHSFVGEAFGLGASLAVVEDETALGGRPGIVVGDSRAALSRLASLFVGDPTRVMTVIGVTGTNGKTTTHWILYHALNSLGINAVRIGTLGVEAKDSFGDGGSLTTPAPIELHRYFARALRSGCRAAVMEASSHALHQKRTADVKFDIGVFSNLTRDHLDYHATMEEYFAAKEILFEQIAQSASKIKAAVINLDDEYGRKAAAKFIPRLADYSFGFSNSARVKILDFEESSGRARISLGFDGQSHSAETSFIGAHNASNLASVVGALLAVGVPFPDALNAAAQAPSVPGRLEPIFGGGVAVFVDYAHTPDALARALAALRPSTKGRLYAVFGCGGDRDKGKRPIMGETAARFADRVVVTSDNPRTEEPNAIIEDILGGVPKPFLTDPDRRSAIIKTLSSAEPGDVILIAGKGHEDYQVIGEERLPFSDQEVVREYFRKIGR